VASGEPYAYVTAAAIAGVEAVEVWLLWLLNRAREAPARATGSIDPGPLARALRSRRQAAPRWMRG
jgi:hypothetical protein